MKITALARVGAAAATGVVLLTGGAVALAPAANAVGGHSRCTADANYTGKVRVANVNLRKGPGTSHKSYGQLTKGARVYVDCYRQPDITKQPWLYVKVKSGAHTGKRGWVRNDLVR
ncbi:SH3 domain-containing protein [Streptomyces sp. S07_1.15]|uniref:SH3 domain-containing protein n=1 Tax=Streptomyces sp. S07_1.15 TaxID=2873925 RepID=UPI001D152379|nr:SH3 domain-containing protein [Streptomyces sp. S07_1.15]MCC3655763.1 SH3 domain-containing protein [Streptomyces sp. S07_1.15]